MFSTLKLKVNSDWVSPTTIEKSFVVSFFLSRTTNLTLPSAPTAEKSGSWLIDAALRSLSNCSVLNSKETSSLGRVISLSGGITITLGSAKKNVCRYLPSRIITYPSLTKSNSGALKSVVLTFKNWFKS